MIQILSVVVNGHWRPGIGDPTFMGWLITAAYFITSVSCGICAWRTDRISPINRSGYHRVFWWSLFAIMLIMGMNKQLDLQCLLIVVIKQIAQNQNWYSKRHILQVWFAAGITIFSMVLLIWLGWKLKRQWRQYGLAIIGIVLLIAFVIITIAPVHCMNQFLGLQPGDRLIKSIFEISGIVLIGISALMGIIRGKKQAAKISSS